LPRSASFIASHGRILRVCGKDVSLVFEKSFKVDGFKGEWEMTEAFFGLDQL